MFFPKHCDAWHSQQFLDIMLFLSKLSPMFMFRNMAAFLTYLVHCIQTTVLQHYSLKDPIFIFTDCEIVYDLQPYVALGNMLHSWLLSTVILILHPHICICLDHWKNVFKHHVKAPRQCKKKSCTIGFEIGRLICTMRKCMPLYEGEQKLCIMPETALRGEKHV